MKKAFLLGLSVVFLVPFAMSSCGNQGGRRGVYVGCSGQRVDLFSSHIDGVMSGFLGGPSRRLRSSMGSIDGTLNRRVGYHVRSLEGTRHKSHHKLASNKSFVVGHVVDSIDTMLLEFEMSVTQMRCHLTDMKEQIRNERGSLNSKDPAHRPLIQRLNRMRAEVEDRESDLRHQVHALANRVNNLIKRLEALVDDRLSYSNPLHWMLALELYQINKYLITVERRIRNVW